jgi:hypothetical protein
MRNLFYLVLTLIFMAGCAGHESISDLSQQTAAPMSSYPVKETPIGADKLLITDTQDANRTKNVTIESLPFTDTDTTYTAGTGLELVGTEFRNTVTDTDSFSSYTVTTTVGATGTDTNVPSEQAVREAIAAVGSGVPDGTTDGDILEWDTGAWSAVAPAEITFAGSVSYDEGTNTVTGTDTNTTYTAGTGLTLTGTEFASTATDDQNASEVTVDATGFTGNLESTDTNVQTALETLDALTIGSGDAADIDVADTADYYTGTDVEAILAEIAGDIGAIEVGSPVTTAPTYSDEDCTLGEYAFTADHFYACRATDTWTRIAWATWSNPTPVAPTMSSATVGSTGIAATLAFSEDLDVGAGGSGGWVMDCDTTGEVSMTYDSGDGTSSFVYDLGETVLDDETCTVDYTQPGDGLENSANTDLASISGAAVTNNSTQSGITYLIGDPNAEVSATDIMLNPDTVYASSKTALASGGLTKGYLYVKDKMGITASDEYVRLVVYDTDATRDLVAQSNLVSGDTISNGAWLEFTFSSGSLTANESYYVGFIASDYFGPGVYSTEDFRPKKTGGTPSSPPSDFTDSSVSSMGELAIYLEGE